MGLMITPSGRLYDPRTGRFLSRDPAAGVGTSPYRGLDGNPLNLVDPFGAAATPAQPQPSQEATAYADKVKAWMERGKDSEIYKQLGMANAVSSLDALLRDPNVMRYTFSSQTGRATARYVNPVRGKRYIEVRPSGTGANAATNTMTAIAQANPGSLAHEAYHAYVDRPGGPSWPEAQDERGAQVFVHYFGGQLGLLASIEKLIKAKDCDGAKRVWVQFKRQYYAIFKVPVETGDKDYGLITVTDVTGIEGLFGVKIQAASVAPILDKMAQDAKCMDTKEGPGAKVPCPCVFDPTEEKIPPMTPRPKRPGIKR